MRQLLRAGALMTVLLTGVCFTGNAVAQDLKIAVVDIESLTLTSDEGKAVNDKLKKFIGHHGAEKLRRLSTT